MASIQGSPAEELHFLVIRHASTLIRTRDATPWLLTVRLLPQFDTGIYFDEYDPTEGPARCVKTYENTQIVFDIEDQAPLSSLRENSAFLEYHLERTDVLLSVFEPSRPHSLEDLESVRFGKRKPAFEQWRRYGSVREAVFVLWREDEMTSLSEETEQWKTGTAQGREFAHKADALGPYHGYTRSGQGIEAAFQELALKILDERRRMQEFEATAQASEGRQGSRKAALEERPRRSILNRFWHSIGTRSLA
ncbi:hypothetical protein LIA77_04084 [Sarocladium implicatum]|nr:hypothetical protein LIA77_04084 [Sarocladium implicatum]